jgi:hypothetical protein
MKRLLVLITMFLLIIPVGFELSACKKKTTTSTITIAEFFDAFQESTNWRASITSKTNKSDYIALLTAEQNTEVIYFSQREQTRKEGFDDAYETYYSWETFTEYYRSYDAEESRWSSWRSYFNDERYYPNYDSDFKTDIFTATLAEIFVNDAETYTDDEDLYIVSDKSYTISGSNKLTFAATFTSVTQTINMTGTLRIGGSTITIPKHVIESADSD